MYVRRMRPVPVAMPVVMAIAVGAALVGCNSGSSDPPATSGAASSSTTATESVQSPMSTSVQTTTSSSPPKVTSAGRPEGNWTLVAWIVKRSDLATPQRTARVMLGSFTPQCAAGACDLVLAPAGANGTYRESEAPVGDGATPSKDSIELRWNGTSYTGTTPTRTSSCTLPGGAVAAGGYTSSATLSLTFVPGSGAAPARVVGVREETAKGTAVGKAKGCTDFVETESVAGVATGSATSPTPVAGTYDASLSTRATTPSSLAAVGAPLWLGQMTLAGVAGSTTITGLLKASAPVSSAGSGWSADAAGPNDCRAASGTVVAKGADGVEAFSGLRMVALTGKGDPIYAGAWKLTLTPNATGRSGGCPPATYEGRVYLVPHDAGS